jgi:putative transposase
MIEPGSDGGTEPGPREKEPADQEIGVPGGVPRGDPSDSPWHSRGYLPHFDSPERTQHVTFHLADSLPREVIERLDQEIRLLPPAEQDAERRMRIEAWIDAGHGSCILREPGIAAMVQNALLFFDGQRYRLMAWTVMPNHVHALFQVKKEWPLAKIVASWKKFTASRICAFRRQPENASGYAELPIGPVWHREYWDRYIRNERHFHEAVDYIHKNPVKAGLVAQPADWPWSSARLRKNQDDPEKVL